MGIKERQERERVALRDAILDAARELFVIEGYRNVSLRKIADRIEYSPAAIYSYFPNKDAIFFALAEEGFRLLAQAAADATAGIGDPYERLRRALLAFYRFSKEHPQYFDLMFVERSVPNLSQDFQRFEFIEQMTAKVEADIKACIERGQFSRRLDSAAALHVLWVGMLGAATIGLAQRLAPGENPDALAEDVLTSLLAGFTTDITTTFVASDCIVTNDPHAMPVASGLHSPASGASVAVSRDRSPKSEDRKP